MSIQSEKVVELVKKELKSRGLRYEEVAERLGMSVSGLKKSLASEDLSLSRLQKICSAIDISMIQLLTAADDEKVQDVFMTPEQETLLLKNPSAFHLYWKLRFDQMALHHYTTSYSAGREEVRARLRQLEKVGLVKIDAKGDLEFSNKGMIRWNNFGPLVEHLNRTWSAELIESLLKKKDPQSLLHLSILQLGEASHAELKEDLRQVLNKYLAQSKRDRMLLGSSQIRKVALLMASDEYQFVK